MIRSQQAAPRRVAAPLFAAGMVSASIFGSTGCSSDQASTFGSPATTTTPSSGAGGQGGGAGTGGTETTSSVGGQSSGGGSGGEGTVISCPSDPLAPGEHQREIHFDGNDRRYEVQVPLSYDNSVPVPLVLDIHGYSSNKDQQQLVSGMDDKAEDEGFVVVRPNGYGALARSWNAGDFCCGDAQAADLDDVGLMRAIVAEVSTSVCVDPKRVYATGISNGGALSHRLACEAGDLFAAVAPVAYPLDFDPFTGCQPSRPMPVIHLHGTHDLVVPYGGGVNSAAVPDSFNYWGQVNGCSGLPTETYSKGSSYCESYASCSGGVEVTLCSIDGGHVLYINADSVPVADLAWAFLSRFTLP